MISKKYRDKYDHAGWWGPLNLMEICELATLEPKREIRLERCENDCMGWDYTAIELLGEIVEQAQIYMDRDGICIHERRKVFLSYLDKASKEFDAITMRTWEDQNRRQE